MTDSTLADLPVNAAPAAAAPPKRVRRDWTPANYDLRDTWFPVAFSRHLSSRPLRRIVHAQSYYLWREGDGKARASEMPPELLGGGKHLATEFTGGTGYYPVVERYGYAWAWYGNPDQADPRLIPHVPFLPEDGVDIPKYMQRTIRYDACSPLAVENLIDLTHADFLHTSTIGEGDCDSDVVEVEWTSETVTRTRIVTGRAVAPIMRWVGGIRAQFQDLRSTLHIHLRSNVAISFPRFKPGYDIPHIQGFVPVGRHRARVDVTQYTQAAPRPFRFVMPRMAYTIAPEDNLAVREQMERYEDDGLRLDLHSRFDKPSVRYRFQLEQLAERQRNGDLSYRPDAEPGRDIRSLLGMDR